MIVSLSIREFSSHEKRANVARIMKEADSQ